MNRIYLDYNATTPLAPEVEQAIVANPHLFGNAFSLHQEGRAAAEAIGAARAEVALLIGAADPSEIVFTSGGSEANGLVLDAFLGEKVVISAIEHPSIMEKAHKQPIELVKYLGVDEDGLVKMDELERLLHAGGARLVSVMLANNETGTLQDVKQIVKIAHAAGVLVHTDAVQAVGKVPVNAQDLGVDYLSLSAHKIHGPKGVGALYVRRGSPKIQRAGTPNTQGIIGLGAAAKLARENLPKHAASIKKLRNQLRDGIQKAIPNIHINGSQEHIVPNTLNVSFPGAEGESVLLALDAEGIAVSTGSACAATNIEPSHVLLAMGLGAEVAHGSIRFSLGPETTQAEIKHTLEAIPPIIDRLRKMSTANY